MYYNNNNIFSNGFYTPYDNLFKKMTNYTLSKLNALQEQKKIQYFDFLHSLVNDNLLLSNTYFSHQFINVIQYLYDDKDSLINDMLPTNIKQFITYNNPYTNPRFAPLLYSINFYSINNFFDFVDYFINNYADIRIKYDLLNSNAKVKNKLILKLTKELQCIMSAC